jgi:hypothetical protein
VQHEICVAQRFTAAVTADSIHEASAPRPLRSAFDFSVENLGIFLQWLLPGNVTYQRSAIKFIEGFYSPVSDIVQRLKNAEEGHVQWSADHAAAIQRFWDFL